MAMATGYCLEPGSTASTANPDNLPPAATRSPVIPNFEFYTFQPSLEVADEPEDAPPCCPEPAIVSP